MDESQADVRPAPTGTLARALADFQAAAPRVAKDKTARVPMQSGGSYSYSYADLADVAAAAYPLLAQAGLSFSCCPRHSDRGYELVGLLMHESGESLEGVLPLPGSTPQQIGSAITYARRYLLGSMTGIVTDTDDDGALTQEAQKPRPARKPAAAPAPRGKASETGEVITAAQTRALRAALKEAGLTDKVETRALIDGLIGRVAPSASDLTKHEAAQVIDHLKTLPAASAGVTPVPSKLGGSQRIEIITQCKRLGIEDRDERLHWLSVITGRAVDTSNDLSRVEARKVLHSLSSYRDRAALEAALAGVQADDAPASTRDTSDTEEVPSEDAE